MMDIDIRKRHSSLKLSSDVVEDKSISSQRKISSQSLSKLEEKGSKYAFSNVPNVESVDSNSNCEFDSLVSSTCSSGDFYDISGELIDAYKNKISQIHVALQTPIDRELLRSLARSEGGLLNDIIRRKVWPELLEIGNKTSTFSATDHDIESHKEYHQVVLDVNRSLKRFPPGISNVERIILQDQLTKLILSVIVKHPSLCYYQGYHDVAVTLLLVVGDEKDQRNLYVEDEAEEPGAWGRSLSAGDVAEGDEDLDWPASKEQQSIGEKSLPSPSKKLCKERIAKKRTLVPERKPIEIDDQSEESKCVEFEKKNLPHDDGNSTNSNDISLQTASKTHSLALHKDDKSEEESDEHSKVKLNGVGNNAFSLNGVEGDGSDGGDNVENVSDSFLDFWDEKESVDSPASGHVISMWCSAVALKMLEHLSLHHFRGCMEPTMDATSRLLHHVFPIVAREDHMLCAFLDRSGVGTVYCLPWILTWYGHSLSNHDIVVRLYDYFLASPVTAPLYLAASIILYRRKEILDAECDMAAVHGLLSQIPDDLPFELLLSRASALYEAYPPESLQKDVEERSARELQTREERSSKWGVARVSQSTSNSALIPWPLLAVLPPHYVNRLVPWFWLTRGRMQWLGAWARMIPMRHINGRYVLAAIPFAMYYAYSHLASNAGN